jgi:hypothetical protein
MVCSCLLYTVGERYFHESENPDFNVIEPSYNVPKNSAIITMVNSFHSQLIYYQVQVLRNRGIFKHLVDSFYVVNLDLESYEKCAFLKIKNCVKGSVDNLIERSDYKTGAYQQIIFAKWHILKQALKTFEYVFFFDADVSLFDNPWGNVGLDNFYDMQHQMELFGDSDSVNSGQMLFRKSNASLSLIDYVLSKENFTEMDRLDQDWVREAAEYASAKLAALPKQYFVGACWKNEVDASVIDVVSYHSHCVEHKEHSMHAINIAFLNNLHTNNRRMVLRDVNFEPYGYVSTNQGMHSLDDKMIFPVHVHNDTDDSSTNAFFE